MALKSGYISNTQITMLRNPTLLVTSDLKKCEKPKEGTYICTVSNDNFPDQKTFDAISASKKFHQIIVPWGKQKDQQEKFNYIWQRLEKQPQFDFILIDPD